MPQTFSSLLKKSARSAREELTRLLRTLTPAAVVDLRWLSPPALHLDRFPSALPKSLSRESVSRQSTAQAHSPGAKYESQGQVLSEAKHVAPGKFAQNRTRPERPKYSSLYSAPFRARVVILFRYQGRRARCASRLPLAFIFRAFGASGSSRILYLIEIQESS